MRRTVRLGAKREHLTSPCQVITPGQNSPSAAPRGVEAAVDTVAALDQQRAAAEGGV